MKDCDIVIIGAGLSGAVVARYMAEVKNRKVLIIEKRDHIGGNMYDYVNEVGILVHKYGPHTFHTNKKDLFDYINKYSEWNEYKLTCGAVIDNKYTPTPFNYKTIDDFFDKNKATAIKKAINEAFPKLNKAAVLDMLNHNDDLVREYANFLFEKDYSLYTAKQWGIPPSEVDTSILKRVPVRFNYEIGYFDDTYQVMPSKSYTHFFQNLLDHPNISIKFNTDALKNITLDFNEKKLMFNEEVFEGAVVYTGAVDELFQHKYGNLPYRSLRFEWKTEKIKSFQDAPVVAYPQAEGYTRITEYTKLPVQDVGNITSYAVEYPLPYEADTELEPYYPVLTNDTMAKYEKYLELTKEFSNLYLCGRLADFKYYNMDQALDKALEICKVIL